MNKEKIKDIHNGWERLKFVIEFVDATSLSSFAREIRCNSSETIFQIRKGNNGISRSLATKIVAKYPFISITWLYLGEGEVFKATSQDETICDPYFDWLQLEKVIEFSGKTTSAFARDIGLSRAETLYQIKKGNNHLSKELIKRIKNKYPNISVRWLLTGVGEMFE